jgi:hypothetical protein
MSNDENEQLQQQITRLVRLAERLTRTNLAFELAFTKFIQSNFSDRETKTCIKERLSTLQDYFFEKITEKAIDDEICRLLCEIEVEEYNKNLADFQEKNSELWIHCQNLVEMLENCYNL